MGGGIRANEIAARMQKGSATRRALRQVRNIVERRKEFMVVASRPVAEMRWSNLIPEREWSRGKGSERREVGGERASWSKVTSKARSVLERAWQNPDRGDDIAFA